VYTWEVILQYSCKLNFGKGILTLPLVRAPTITGVMIPIALVTVCEIPNDVLAKLLPRSRLFIKLPPEYAPLAIIPKIRTTMMAVLLHPSCVMTKRKMAHPILPVATIGIKLKFVSIL
jgi:hypothetical protein